MRMRTILMMLAAVAALGGCEGTTSNEYLPQYIVQGVLIVGEPIEEITVSRSLSITDTFRLSSSAIGDARVAIEVDGATLDLVYRADTALGEYRYPDSTFLVQPRKVYRLRVTLADGTVMTGETLTPKQIEWIHEPADTVQFPSDTVTFPPTDSLRLQWTTVDAAGQYMISLRTLDTLGYGRYLTPPTDEPNRRTPRLFGRPPGSSPDLLRWNLAPASNFIAPWTSFRWFGGHEVTIFAPDYNFFNWFRLTNLQQQRQYNTLLGSITGGLGVFGSASILKKKVFVLKNQE
jgi:hypothetical protein